MRHAIALLAVLLLPFGASHSLAQSKVSEADELVTKAIKLEDEGKFDEALPLLLKAEQLKPDDYSFPYEVGYWYVNQKDYKNGLVALKRAVSKANATDQAYQMLGNCYDLSDDSAMAMKTYNEGIAKFPKSGKLYLEAGNVLMMRGQNYNEALKYYEKSISIDPTYSSAYYRAASLYLLSTDAVWGMMYGELFMNLERNTDRTSNMSKALYNCYKENIKIHSKDSLTIHFSSNNTIEVSGNGKKIKKKDLKLPFGMIYELCMISNLILVEKVDMETLCTMRSKFLDMYFERGYNKSHPNVLFDYQRKLKDKGLLDAYNHWLLIEGDLDAVKTWLSTHEKQWNDFIAWYKENPIKITEENAFSRFKMQ